MLAWSSELQIKTTEKELEAAEETEEKFSREVKLINHQNCIISELVSMNKALTERVRLLETKQSTCQDINESPAPSLEPAAEASAVGRSDSHNAKSCGTEALPKSPAAMWFEWYAKTPRMWDVCGDRQKKSAYKQTVNYMKLFLPEGFVLDPSAPGYCDEVLRYGTEAEAQLFKFLDGHGIKRRNGSSVLKELRSFYREGKLDTLIAAYRARVAIGGITDPAPHETQELFARVAQIA